MIARSRRGLARGLLLLVGMAGCAKVLGYDGTLPPTDGAIGHPCAQTSDCVADAQCIMYLCSPLAKCCADDDCPDGFRCLSNSGPNHAPACIPANTTCAVAGCPVGDVCTDDGLCRNTCALGAGQGGCLGNQTCEPCSTCGTGVCIGGPPHDVGDAAAPPSGESCGSDSGSSDANESPEASDSASSDESTLDGSGGYIVITSPTNGAQVSTAEVPISFYYSSPPMFTLRAPGSCGELSSGTCGHINVFVDSATTCLAGGDAGAYNDFSVGASTTTGTAEVNAQLDLCPPEFVDGYHVVILEFVDDNEDPVSGAISARVGISLMTQ